MTIPFLRGLLSVGWTQIVIAIEDTYKNTEIESAVRQTARNYTGLANAANDLSVAPGLWPLGHYDADKSSRASPSKLQQYLREAFAAAKQYVWIYGCGSAWQSDGPHGAGPVASNFTQHVDPIHQVRASCSADDAP